MYREHIGVLLGELEKLMANIGHKLMIKYGLPEAPSDDQIALWKERTTTFIQQGYDREESGKASAKLTFVGYETHVYASEADDIVALLDAAGDS